MKKVLMADEVGFLRFCAVLAALGTWLFLAPSSFAQTHYDLSFIGLPEGNVNLTMYIGLDRKLKPDVPGQVIRITVTPPLVQSKRVRLSLTASAQGSTLLPCNGQIASVLTEFDLSGAGRDLGSSAFTGSGGVAIVPPPPYTNQPCVDALADKMTSGVASLPTGIYHIDAVLTDANTRALLATGSHTIRIESASINEAVINLVSPQNGEYVPSTGSVVFSFDNSIPGRLLAFEHSSLTQSQDDATRDLNSPLKVLDLPITSRGSNQVNAIYPGVAVRSWTAGRKYSWLFLGSVSGSTDVRRSAVWSFTIAPNDPVLARLAMTLASAPDPIGSTFNNLISSGYTLAFSGSNPILLQEGDNGTPRAIDVSQLLSWLADLSRRNVQINAVVTQ